jgi:hypothetical protein
MKLLASVMNLRMEGRHLSPFTISPYLTESYKELSTGQVHECLSFP